MTNNRLVFLVLTLLFISATNTLASDIHRYARLGDLDKVKSEITKQPDLINAKDSQQQTPLHAAVDGVALNRKQMVEYLIISGASLDVKDSLGKTSLHIAVADGDHNKEVVELLLTNGADVNSKTKESLTPLDIASLKGYLNTVKLLIDHGAEVAPQKITLTDSADNAVFAAEIMFAKVLEFYTVNNSEVTNTRKTPMHLASKEGHAEVVELLIAKGSVVNTKDWIGRSPLFYAVVGGHEEVTKVLLNNGASPNNKDSFGFTPLHLATLNNHKELVELLIDKGALVNAMDNMCLTPLHWASFWGSKEASISLINNGAVVNVKQMSIVGPEKEITEFIYLKSEPFFTPPQNWDTLKNPQSNVIIYNWKKNKDKISLITKKTKITSRASYENTPLHYAAMADKKQIARLLIDKKARINAKNLYGDTPLHVAQAHGNKKFADFLIANGADVDMGDNRDVQKESTSQKPSTPDLENAIEEFRKLKRDAIEAYVDTLPEDGIYSEIEGKGGGYKDPMNGFFEVEPPTAFKIIENHDKAIVTIPQGNPNAGKEIPQSCIQFQREKTLIMVIAREAWSDLETDFNRTVDLLNAKGAIIQKKRYITIDGVKGYEIVFERRNVLMFHQIKYIKNGLDHSMSFAGPPLKCQQYQPIFLDFVRSYQSLKSN